MNTLNHITLNGVTKYVKDSAGQAMLAPEELTLTAANAYAVGDLFRYDGKLYKASAAIEVGDTIEVGTNCEETTIAGESIKDVQVNGTSITQDGLANIRTGTGVYSQNGILHLCRTSDGFYKSAFQENAVVINKQHLSTFYGLAKAAGDTTQSQSDNTVGTYTDDAKIAIQKMLGVNENYELIKRVTVTEDTMQIIIDSDEASGPFSIQGFMLFIQSVGASSATQESYLKASLNSNNHATNRFMDFTSGIRKAGSTRSYAIYGKYLPGLGHFIIGTYQDVAIFDAQYDLRTIYQQNAGVFSFSNQQTINSVFVGTDFNDRLLGVGSTVALYGIKV